MKKKEHKVDMEMWRLYSVKLILDVTVAPHTQPRRVGLTCRISFKNFVYHCNR